MGSLTLRNLSGNSRPTSTKRRSVIHAEVDDSGFQVLLKGHGRLRRQFKVLEVDASGVINSNSGWQPVRKALS